MTKQAPSTDSPRALGTTPLGRARTAMTSPRGAAARISVAAVDLFARKGYASTSVRDIVEAAHVSRPSLYYYYGNKEGLYRALLRRGELLIDQLLLEVDKTEGGPWEKIMHLCLGLNYLARQRAPELRMLEACALAPADCPSFGSLEAVHGRVLQRIRSLLSEGRRKNLIRYSEIDDAVAVLRGILLASSPRLSRRSSHPTPDVGRLLSLAYHGLGVTVMSTARCPAQSEKTSTSSGGGSA